MMAFSGKRQEYAHVVVGEEAAGLDFNSFLVVIQSSLFVPLPLHDDSKVVVDSDLVIKHFLHFLELSDRLFSLA